jgi:hypothetical protein
MTNYANPNAFLMGGGAKSAKFENEGDKVVGTITSMEVRQQTDIKTGAPLTWPNDDPMMQLVVTLNTDERDDEEDDGARTLYIKGQMKKAVQDAVRKSGARGLAEGGRLGVKFISTAAPKQRGFNGAKQYAAQYEAPVVQVSGSEYGDDEPF